MLTLLQVTGAAKEGDTIKLTVEPAKGGESETLEADVVLVSAGVGPQLVSIACSTVHPCAFPALLLNHWQLWLNREEAVL